MYKCVYLFICTSREEDTFSLLYYYKLNNSSTKNILILNFYRILFIFRDFFNIKFMLLYVGFCMQIFFVPRYLKI